MLIKSDKQKLLNTAHNRPAVLHTREKTNAEHGKISLTTCDHGAFKRPAGPLAASHLSLRPLGCDARRARLGECPFTLWTQFLQKQPRELGVSAALNVHAVSRTPGMDRKERKNCKMCIKVIDEYITIGKPFLHEMN